MYIITPQYPFVKSFDKNFIIKIKGVGMSKFILTIVMVAIMLGIFNEKSSQKT